jgi:hypothetical protein
MPASLARRAELTPAAHKASTVGVERFYADLEFRLSVRAQRVPEIDKWLQENG